MAIVGNGLIARTIKEMDRPDRTYFASGVSNSGETKQSEFDREKNLLLAQSPAFRLVYFSSLCVFYADTLYARHKREMEELIKREFPMYAIMRLGTITWGDNPHLLINYMRQKHLRGERLQIEDTYRYVTSREEFLHWVGLIPNFNCELNITGRRMKVRDIVTEFVGPGH